jgi:hypothetical protein
VIGSTPLATSIKCSNQKCSIPISCDDLEVLVDSVKAVGCVIEQCALSSLGRIVLRGVRRNKIHSISPSIHIISLSYKSLSLVIECDARDPEDQSSVEGNSHTTS